MDMSQGSRRVRRAGAVLAAMSMMAAGAAIAAAASIRDPLLLIHGMADDNVFLDNSTAVAAAMQQAGTPFEMMFYPGQTHRVGGVGVSVHLWRTILDFLDRHVKEKPAR